MLPILNVSLVKRKLELVASQVAEGNSVEAEGNAVAIGMTIADYNAARLCGHWFAAVIGNEETGVQCHKCENCDRNLQKRPDGSLGLTEDELAEEGEAHAFQREKEGGEISERAELEAEEREAREEDAHDDREGRGVRQ